MGSTLPMMVYASGRYFSISESLILKSTGMKFSFMPSKKDRDHYLVINADEGEPDEAREAHGGEGRNQGARGRDQILWPGGRPPPPSDPPDSKTKPPGKVSLLPLPRLSSMSPV